MGNQLTDRVAIEPGAVARRAEDFDVAPGQLGGLEDRLAATAAGACADWARGPVGLSRHIALATARLRVMWLMEASGNAVGSQRGKRCAARGTAYFGGWRRRPFGARGRANSSEPTKMAR